jgi:hypothetical protein
MASIETLRIFLEKDGFISFEKTPASLRTIRKWLDAERRNDKNAYRLRRSPDIYREVFRHIEKSDQDIFILLSSPYTEKCVDEPFLTSLLAHICETPYYNGIKMKYGNEKAGNIAACLLAESPGLKTLATMFRTSPSVAAAMLFPERLSRYELTHLKPCLDLKFATDMLHIAPEKTDITVKYEVIARGTINVEEKGGTGIP